MIATPPAIVAIPAHNEAERLEACLAALATQRDAYGAPIAPGAFSILVFANNCDDDTVRIVRRWGENGPHPVRCVEERLPPQRANAGCARQRAMDLAAAQLEDAAQRTGVILTTDADSIVASTWISATFAAFARGVDAVAGYIDAHPTEIAALGVPFLRRSRLEDTYLRAIAEIYALCDPRPHDPWPNHRVSSGASLAVTLRAYRRIGGLPPLPVGEDAALTAALEAAGMTVRHPMDVVVSTSCRIVGRARGGAADTMKLRATSPDAPCDNDFEPAAATFRRALWRGRLRRAGEFREAQRPRWAGLGVSPNDGWMLAQRLRDEPYAVAWAAIEAKSPTLQRSHPLHPADLPREITRAERLLGRLRRLAERASLQRPVGSFETPLAVVLDDLNRIIVSVPGSPDRHLGPRSGDQADMSDR